MLGYDKKLFILPFDHRSSFIKGLLGDKTELSDEDIDFLKAEKEIIYEGFKEGIALGVPKDEAAILIDEEYGKEILEDAKRNLITTLVSVEKSGEKEFVFEFSDFDNHLRKFSPRFAKVLLHAESFKENERKIRQIEKLRLVNKFCKENNLKFLIEPLVHHLEEVDFIREQISIIEELNSNGIEPDVWKLEGSEQSENYEEIVKTARRDGREGVGIVILGGGEDKEKVERVIKAGSTVNGVIGFAIGRTIFWDSLISLKNQDVTRDQAIDQIAENYLHFYKIFGNK
jgi:myo-inositol catabolism protein IolC